MRKSLKTKRTVVLKVYTDKAGHEYLKIRDVAAVLGVKQPFEFTADLKARLTPSAVKHGKELVDLTPVDDSTKATYITLLDLYRFLDCGGEWKCKMNLDKKRELVAELKEIVPELN